MQIINNVHVKSAYAANSSINSNRVGMQKRKTDSFSLASNNSNNIAFGAGVKGLKLLALVGISFISLIFGSNLVKEKLNEYSIEQQLSELNPENLTEILKKGQELGPDKITYYNAVKDSLAGKVNHVTPTEVFEALKKIN